MNIKDLHQQGEKLFEKRSGLMSLMQSIADNFYVERADFTVSRALGAEFAAGLMTSYPLIVRRDLGNAFDTMLRPTGKEWFHTCVADEEFRANNDARRWLEWTAGIQRRAMYDRVTQFVRATKEGDHDFATFGQAVLQAEKVSDHYRVGPHLLYRCWHIRDVAWQENRFGTIGSIFRKWKPESRNLVGMESSTWKVHTKVKELATKEPFREIRSMHMCVEADMFDGEYLGRKLGMPYVSLHYDIDNAHVMEAVGKWSKEYVIPRWQTVSGSQYAYSPATIAALPDARLIQAMTGTLLEAGEKAVNPPLWGYPDAIRSDIQVFAGGFTAVDRDYDERLGAPLNALVTAGKDAIPLGIDMQRDSRAMIAEAFFLSKLNMPQTGKEMTAYEVGQRVQEYIRNAMPLFAPMETEYNGALCEETFELMFGAMIRMEAKGVQTPLNIPPSLRGADIQFRFESPLHDAIERQKVGQFMEGKAVLAEALALDPSLAALPDGKTALRDVLQAVWPAKWLNSEAKVDEIEMQAARMKQAQQQLAVVQQGADAAKTISETASNLAPA